MPTGDISELSQVIGELRNFAAQQTATNSHMLEELKKIGERMVAFSEVGAGLQEYRKTLHERFGRIHEMFGDLDERCDKIEAKQEVMEDIIAGWKGQIKTLVMVVGIAGTAVSALISAYGGIIIRALVVSSAH